LSTNEGEAIIKPIPGTTNKRADIQEQMPEKLGRNDAGFFNTPGGGKGT